MNIRYLRYIFVLLVIFISSSARSEISESLMNYRNACEMMKFAINSKDKDKMHQALQMFDNLSVSPLAEESYNLSGSYSVKPSVYYLADFADYLLLNDFIIADLDEASLLRDTSISPDVSVIHTGIDAGKSISIDLEGDGEMNLMVLSSESIAPSIKVTDLSSGAVYDNFKIDGDSSFLSWNMTGLGKFILSVENLDDITATFVIALN